MVRAVLDSTVLISAFLKPGGVSDEILGLAGRTFVLALAPEIIAETRRKLLTSARIRKNASYSDERVRRFCRGLARVAEPISDLPPLRGVVRDPDDDVIVAAAVKARADYLVTRNKDLLALGGYQGIRAITPEAFRGILRAV